MGQFNLLEFQKTAVEELLDIFVSIWKTDKRQIPLVFKSPTGSGKTFMVANFIKGLNHLPNWNYDKAFIWITFSDDLAMQSRDKFYEYFENTLENELLTVQDINHKDKLEKNDILFINWQKIVSKSAESRILRRPTDKLLQKESGNYFEDVIDGTHQDKRQIVLIIDESHKNSRTKLAKEIIDNIDPKIIIKISATPEDEPSISDVRNCEAGYVEISRDKVVEEGLIKEKLVVQTDEDLQQHRGKDLDEVLIDLAIEKKEELDIQLRKLKKEINPLILIQLPNDDRKLLEIGKKTKEQVVLELLTKKGVKENAIALWFDGKRQKMEFVTENDSDIDFLLFKQTAGTGWDCPRAHILVMFREIKSPTFYTQTIGRILRMSEPHLSKDYVNTPDLRAGYLYTNYKRNEISIPDQTSRNKPDIYIAKRKIGIKNIELQSSFITRIDYGDLSNSAKFQASFINSMNKYFKVGNSDILGKATKKLVAKGVNLEPVVTNRLMVNAEFEDFDQLQLELQREGEEMDFEISQYDIQKMFNYLCYQILKEQDDKDAKISNIARSWGPLKSAIRVWFKYTLGEDSNYFYRVFICDLARKSNSIFRPAITKALKDYRPLLNKLLKKRRARVEEASSPVFTVQDEYSYTEDFKEVTQKLCVLDTFYLQRNYSGRENEMLFMEYIDTKDKEIEWWFKNGDSGKDYYAIKYSNTAKEEWSLFYPDWIIMFKDGRIGVFDTKAGRTASDTEGRAEALAKKLKKLGKNYVGGIAVSENGIWYYNCSEDYRYVKGKLSKDWKKMEKLFT